MHKQNVLILDSYRAAHLQEYLEKFRIRSVSEILPDPMMRYLDFFGVIQDEIVIVIKNRFTGFKGRMLLEEFNVHFKEFGIEIKREELILDKKEVPDGS